MSRKAGTPNKPKEIVKQMSEDFQPGYIFLQSEKPDALILHVNGMLEIYQPLGGVSVTNYRADNGSIVMVYCQAMVRREG